MAGGGSPTPSKSGKKSVDFVVNLIPAIDLLSVLIAFLLMTAVWTQLARINTDQVVSPTSVPIEEKQEEIKNLNILLTSEEVVMNITGMKPAIHIPRMPEEKYVKDVRLNLKELKDRLGGDNRSKVMLAAEDKVVYKNMIQIMDICLDIKLSGITVAPAAAVQGQLL